MKKINFIDCFAGIGGFRQILENSGHNCIGFSEINKQAIKYYQMNYDTTNELNLGDIKTIQKIEQKVDLITAGVPCQPWSTAGKNKGFNDPRGQLWHDTLALLDKLQPKMFIFENVKGLIDPRNKKSLNYILETINKKGYYYKVLVLNANDFGTPQERVRVFIVGTKDKKQFEEMKIPNKLSKKSSINEFLSLGIKETFGIDYMTLTDVRDGENTIHSWDIIETSDIEKDICFLLLKNRRKNKYGEKDGNPLSLIDLQDLNSNIKMQDIKKLISKNILIEKESGKYDFVNSKISSGINGIYRIYSPHSKTFSTITASGGNDFLAHKCFKDKKDFINDILLKNNYSKLNKEQALKMQGYHENFKVPENYSGFIKLIGNSVPLQVIKQVVKMLGL